jgi:hypothetical protein
MVDFVRNNRRHVLLEVLVLIVVIAFCGLTVMYIKRANDIRINSSPTVSTTKTAPKAVVPNDTPPQGKPPVSISTSISTGNQTSTQSNQTTIDIKPLGISITLPSSMSDLTYSSSTSSNGEVTVNFSTATITDEVSTCSASSGQGAFDSITKADGQYPSSASSNEGLIKQEPTYYIAYILPSGPCAHNLNPDVESLLDQDAGYFYSALSTIQVIN